LEETAWNKLHLQNLKIIYVTLAGGGGILSQLHCRPRSLLQVNR